MGAQGRPVGVGEGPVRGWALVKFHPGETYKEGEQGRWLDDLKNWAAGKGQGWEAVRVEPKRGITSMDALVQMRGSKQDVVDAFDHIEENFSHVEGYTA